GMDWEMTETLVEADIALSAIQQYCDADNPSAFLAVNEGNSYFRLPDAPGVIVYRRAGRYLVQFGGPFAPPAVRRRLLRAFVDHADGGGAEFGAVQLQGAAAPPYLEQGFVVNQMGASYARSLADFSLYGTRFMQLRNKISRSVRAGLEVYEAPYE